MPAIVHVKAAQQRYETVPVLDAHGEPVQIQKKNADGSPVVTKRGHLVFMTKTRPDKSKPKPPELCGKCGKAIDVGSPYKHITPKSGRLVRCEDCPDWDVWEYSSSLSARLAEISYYFWENLVEVTTQEDVQSALSDAAQAIHDIALEKREAAENIESGFQHATYQSDELNQQADDLDSWADEIESADVPTPEIVAKNCDACKGNGYVSDDDPEDCPACEGNGYTYPEALTAEQLEDWRSELQDALSLIDDSPV
jgi:hypothetical protein